MANKTQTAGLRAVVAAGFLAATHFMGLSLAQAQTTATPVISASTTSNVTTLTITDATPGTSIYYAPGGRTPTTNSIQYTGPLTISLPYTISAIAVAPGSAQSAVATTSYSAVLGATSVTSSANPSLTGQAITFTGTVTPNSGNSLPSGTLQFYVNGTPLGSSLTLQSNSASYTTSDLPESYLSVTAAYTPTAGAPTTTATSPALIQGVYESARQSTNVWFNNASKPLGTGYSKPYGVALDSNKNLFVADTNNGVIKELTASSGYSTATVLSPSFYWPVAITIDPSNNLFIADSSVNAVYELPAAGNYTNKIVIGSGFNSPSGIVAASNGDLFVADTGNHAVKYLSAASGYTTISQVGGSFQYPWGITIDSNNNLFVSDVGNHDVYLSSPPNYSSSTLLGGPGSGYGFFSNPYGLAIDSNDDLFVTDVGYQSVREISLVDGWSTVSTAGFGLSTPIGIALDAADNVFVSDTSSNSVREVTGNGGNFGSVTAGATTPYAISMNFFFDTRTTLGSTAVLTQSGQYGTASPDFSDAGTGNCYPNTPYAGVSFCTVDVVFNPSKPGPLSAVVELLDSSSNVLAYGTVQGVGVAH